MIQKGKNRLILLLLALIVAIGCGLCFIAAILSRSGEIPAAEATRDSDEMLDVEFPKASGFDFDTSSGGFDDENASAEAGLALPVQAGAYDIPVSTSVGFGDVDAVRSTERQTIKLNVIHSGEAVGDKYPGRFSVDATGEPFAYVSLTCDCSFRNGSEIYELVLDENGCASVDFDICSEGRITLRADYSRGESSAAESISFKVDGKPPKLFLGNAAAGEAVLTGLSEPGASITLTAPGTDIGTLAGPGGAFMLEDHAFVQGIEYVVTATDPFGNSTSQKFIPEKQTPVYDTAYEVPVTSVEASDSGGEGMVTLSISGTAAPGAGVDIFVNGIYCMSVTAAEDGTWHAVIMAPVSESGYDVHAVYSR